VAKVINSRCFEIPRSLLRGCSFAYASIRWRQLRHYLVIRRHTHSWPEFRHRLRKIAAEKDTSLIEVLREAIDLYEKKVRSHTENDKSCHLMPFVAS
jgi:hypothetical protein